MHVNLLRRLGRRKAQVAACREWLDTWRTDLFVRANRSNLVSFLTEADLHFLVQPITAKTEPEKLEWVELRLHVIEDRIRQLLAPKANVQGP